VFLHGMSGSTLPIATAHGEGRATFSHRGAAGGSAAAAAQQLVDAGLVPFRYLDNGLLPTERYPFNPNGSPLGIAGVRTPDGKVLAMMPHPERTVLKDACSWAPEGQVEGWGEFGPWVRLFRSARRWVG